MDDKPAISIIKDTLGKPSRAYDDARNVKTIKEGLQMVGNGLSPPPFFYKCDMFAIGKGTKISKNNQ